MIDMLGQMGEALYAGDQEEVVTLVKYALEAGMPPNTILQEGLIAGMDVVGRDFKAGDLFVPEVLVSARAMHAGMNELRPLLTKSEASSSGVFVIGTVKGDMHDIGKNLVKMMLEGAGFEVVDLGTDVAPETFVQAVREHQPHVVGMSALLTTTMVSMQATVNALTEAGVRDSVKILVGGAPVTADFAQKIGADAFAPDAAAAVEVARGFIAPAVAKDDR